MAPKLKDIRSPAQMVATLKALAEETRLRLLRVLSEGPLGVNDISERLELSAYKYFAPSEGAAACGAG